MAKIRKRWGFCPVCGKTEISREPAGKINYDVGGWNEWCQVCNSLLWVPADPTKPIEIVVMPGIPAFEPGIIFDSEIKLLKAMSRGEK